MRSHPAAILACLTAAASQAAAQAPPPVTLALSGALAHPRTLSAADLDAAPKLTVQVPASAAPGAAAMHATGVLLWSLLDAAGWADQPGRKTHLQHVILARGRDGYAVALSIAEIDPGFEAKQVVIATEQDGRKLPGLELVVPGDRKPGRRVHDLVAVDVK